MRIAFLGDIALIGKYDLVINPHVKKRLNLLAEKLNEFDFVVANLESPLTDKSSSLVCKSMHLRTSSVNVELLKYLNIKAVTLGNNHIHDFGKKGLEDTIAILEQNGIEWFGANAKQLVREIKGEKVCFSGFCCYSANGTGYIENNDIVGINTLTYDNVMQQLQRDRDNEAFTILSLHWGIEHTNYPSYEHVKLTEALAEVKDVLVHGHHPHIIQGVRKINSSVVAYSLGNCLFDDCTSINGGFTLKQNKDNKKSFIFEVEIQKGKIINFDHFGFKDEDEGLVFFDITEELQKISEPLNKVSNISLYESKRKEQFNKAILNKFGKHDFKWFKSRLNYYSIGARIASVFRNKKYLRETQKFIGGKKYE